MTRRVLAVVATAATGCALAGCSGSETSAPPGATSTITAVTRVTMSNGHVTGVVARYLPGLRAAIAEEHTFCGAGGGIEQSDPTAAAKCAQALRKVSAGAHDLASALVLMRPSDALAPQVADTSDAARAISAVSSTFSVGECLPTPPAATPTRARCATAGRDFTMLIAQLGGQLDRWQP